MKSKLTLVLTVILLLAMSVIGTVAAQDDVTDNIVDIVAKNDDFSTLYSAIIAANLADTLASADNTFTVFAPTDAAFGNVDPGTLASLLADPQGALTQVLTYHVVPGELMSGAVVSADTLTTVQGETLDITVEDGEAFVNGNRIVTVDIPAKNGVIHVIDGVLVPDAVAQPAAETVEEAVSTAVTAAAAVVEETEPVAALVEPDMTIAEIAQENGSFTTLLAALEAAGLADTFAQPGSYTVFAPTDQAFDALGEERLNQLLADPEGELSSILQFHVVGDTLTRNQLATDDLVPTLDGRPLEINRDGSNIIDINGAQVLIYNIPASNGIIHVIDRVLIP